MKCIFFRLFICLIAPGSTFAVDNGAGRPGVGFPSAGTRILVTAMRTYRRDEHLPCAARLWGIHCGHAARRFVNGLALFSLCVYVSQDRIRDCCLELQAPEMRITMDLWGVCSSVLVSPPDNFHLALKSLFRNSERIYQSVFIPD